jgi:hypothetical protein
MDIGFAPPRTLRILHGDVIAPERSRDYDGSEGRYIFP